jgi:RNA polymerase sigma factor (sigma-70 family)
VGQPPSELEEFCRRESLRLVGALTLYTGDVQLAEELTQETLTRVAQAWGKVSRMDAPGVWAYRIALNLARSHFRRMRVARRVQAQLAGAGSAVSAPDTAEALAVRSAVAALPERLRRALILRYWFDLPVADVADAMGCPPNTVKTLTRRAVAALREAHLIDDEPEAADVN